MRRRKAPPPHEDAPPAVEYTPYAVAAANDDNDDDGKALNPATTAYAVSSSWWPLCGDLVLALAMAFHLATSPFCKVEESFNLQAVHDFLTRLEFDGVLSSSPWAFGGGEEEAAGPGFLASVSAFDHLEFPGVVPRSFLGAAAVAAVAWLPHALCVELWGWSLLHGQAIARASLG